MQSVLGGCQQSAPGTFVAGPQPASAAAAGSSAAQLPLKSHTPGVDRCGMARCVSGCCCVCLSSQFCVAGARVCLHTCICVRAPHACGSYSCCLDTVHGAQHSLPACTSCPHCWGHDQTTSKHVAVVLSALEALPHNALNANETCCAEDPPVHMSAVSKAVRCVKCSTMAWLEGLPNTCDACMPLGSCISTLACTVLQHVPIMPDQAGRQCSLALERL